MFWFPNKKGMFYKFWSKILQGISVHINTTVFWVGTWGMVQGSTKRQYFWKKVGVPLATVARKAAKKKKSAKQSAG